MHGDFELRQYESSKPRTPRPARRLLKKHLPTDSDCAGTPFVLSIYSQQVLDISPWTLPVSPDDLKTCSLQRRLRLRALIRPRTTRSPQDERLGVLDSHRRNWICFESLHRGSVLRRDPYGRYEEVTSEVVRRMERPLQLGPWNPSGRQVVHTDTSMGANGFDRAGSIFSCEPWILVGHVKNGKKSSCE